MEYQELSTNISYLYIFGFEKSFLHNETRKWMIDNWTWGFLYCMIYVILIFSVQHWMKSRPKFQLSTPLIIWNWSLALFSIMGSIRMLPEFHNSITQYGIYHSVCVPRYIVMDKVSGFWTFMFALSKLPELGDSIFIVLRKRPLIFLHYYHHTTVLLYTWFTYTEYIATARWFIVMNYCVHSVMYSYFALRSMNVHVPRFMAQCITFMQIVQMFLGLTVNLLALYFIKIENRICQTTLLNIKLSTALYSSYIYLFTKFFFQAYYSPRLTRSQVPVDQSKLKHN